jgi:hypothetical protein
MNIISGNRKNVPVVVPYTPNRLADSDLHYARLRTSASTVWNLLTISNVIKND